MDNTSINIKEKQIEILEKYKTKLKNPLIIGFLSKEENYELFKKATLDPSKENIDLIEKSFHEHCYNIKMIKYVDSLIRNYSVDYDKKIRKNNNRYPLIIDSQTSTNRLDSWILYENEYTTVQDDLSSGGKNLKNHISNTKLLHALEGLTNKQFLILELIYIEELNLKEIASRLNTTPQNISNIHRKAINNLRKKIMI